MKGQRTVNELVQEFGVHPNEISLWKKQLVQSASELFRCGKNREAERVEIEGNRLYWKVGQLQVEMDWLKKKIGHLD